MEFLNIYHSRSWRSGFTLVEIMIVVCIIGLLAAIAVPSFIRARENTKINRFLNDLRIATAAFEQYKTQTGQYPPDCTPGVIPQNMKELLAHTNWPKPNTIGGQWDWDQGQFGFCAGVSVYRPTMSHACMQLIDSKIDDGNLNAGRFRERLNGFIYIIEE